MTPTEQFIDALARLQPGERSLLRRHGDRGLDESVDGFDLFTGLWWPLRANSPKAPRRGVAWLVAKLYASCPTGHSAGDVLARQLRRSQPGNDRERERFRLRFDALLTLPREQIEPSLRWALDWIASRRLAVDWVRLTDDLSAWEREATRVQWARQFLETEEGDRPC